MCSYRALCGVAGASGAVSLFGETRAPIRHCADGHLRYRADPVAKAARENEILMIISLLPTRPSVQTARMRAEPRRCGPTCGWPSTG
jgi:hypothetical protein